MAEDRKKSLIFWQTKGNNSAVTDDTQIKLHMQNLTMVIYIQFKIHAIPSIGYLVMAEDGKVDGWTEGRTTPNLYPRLMGGGGGGVGG